MELGAQRRKGWRDSEGTGQHHKSWSTCDLVRSGRAQKRRQFADVARLREGSRRLLLGEQGVDRFLGRYPEVTRSVVNLGLDEWREHET